VSKFAAQLQNGHSRGSLRGLQTRRERLATGTLREQQHPSIGHSSRLLWRGYLVLLLLRSQVQRRGERSHLTVADSTSNRPTTRNSLRPSALFPPGWRSSIKEGKSRRKENLDRDEGYSGERSEESRFVATTSITSGWIRTRRIHSDESKVSPSLHSSNEWNASHRQQGGGVRRAEGRRNSERKKKHTDILDRK